MQPFIWGVCFETERELTAGCRHRALIAYLTSNNLPSTAAALRAEIGLGEDAFDATTSKKYEGLLEKKWTSVVRLQKKVGSHFALVIF